MKTTRRVFVLLLAAVTLLCMMPGLSFAEPNCKVTATAINNGTVSISGSQYMNTVTALPGPALRLHLTLLRFGQRPPGDQAGGGQDQQYAAADERDDDEFALFHPLLLSARRT